MKILNKRFFNRKIFGRLFIMALCPFCMSACTKTPTSQTISKDENTGLLVWTSIAEGINLELVQMLPNFVRARYSSQNFPNKEIEDIASYCVFGTIMKNTSQHTLSYKVSNWYTVTHGESKKKTIKSKSNWLKQWQSANVNFHWTLFPDEGKFAIGDWQQGFTTIKIPRDKQFDLFYQWKINDKLFENWITDISCSPEDSTNE